MQLPEKRADVESTQAEGAGLRAGAGAGEVCCTGNWTLRSMMQLEKRLDSFSWPGTGEIMLDAAAVEAMDTSGAWLLHRTIHALEARGRTVRLRGLRPEFNALVAAIVARGVPTEAQPRGTESENVLARIGRRAWHGACNALGIIAFLGEGSLHLARSLMHPGRMRWRPVLHNLQIAGFEAMPITGLLCFLMGVVIAYQGAEQLQRYGANIFVADLVGLSMVRELSPLLTAIIVAGRSGSAYAAQIGTMKITEEIDALRTIGVVPMELLVLPKVLALIIALPLLTVYTDIMGVLGGMIMARAQLDVGFGAFLDRLDDAISLSSYLIGLGKAPVFAVIIGLVGCYQGFQVSGSADSVGRQTTVSVVQSIFLVIVADALFSIVFSWLDI